MGQMKISEMQLVQQVNKEDYIPIVQDGANKKISAENLMDYNVMKNKPRINGKELSSENSLDYLEIQPKGNYVTKEEFNANDFATAAEIEKKLDKNLGKENSQKVLQISESGEVKAVEAVGGNNVVYKSGVAEPAIINDSFNKVNKGIEIYGQSKQENTTGINLLDYPKKKVFDSEFYDVDENGFVIQLQSDNRVNNTVPESIKLPSGVYTASIEDGTAESYFQVYDLTDDRQLVIVDTVRNKSQSFTLDKETSISFKIYGLNDNLAKARVQINTGNSALPWEPYTGGKPSPSPDYQQEIISKEVSSIIVSNGASESQTITLSEPITLRGIPVASGGNVTIDGQQYISDVICDKDGVVGIERNVAHYEITGNENVTKFSDGTFFYIPGLPRKSLSSDNGLCTHCKYLYIGADNDKVGICVAQRSATCRFNLELETVEEYKAMFKQAYDEGNPFKVDYHAEPTFEPLPDEVQDAIRALQMYYPTTIVDCGAPVSVTYEASLQTIFEDLTSKINESINLSNKAILYNKD